MDSSPCSTRTRLVVSFSQMKKEPSSEPLTMYWALLGQRSRAWGHSRARLQKAENFYHQQADTPHTYTSRQSSPCCPQEPCFQSQMDF